jgi:hypothetical protein
MLVKKIESSKFINLLNLQKGNFNLALAKKCLELRDFFLESQKLKIAKNRFFSALSSERGDVPGWVLVVLMTTGLVTAIWTIAAPRLTSILKNSLDAMNGIR